MQDALTLYKLIILYMLNKVSSSMTTAQISDFILEKEYTNSITLSTVLSELTEAGMISGHTVRNRTHVTITDEGTQTLNFFKNRINEALINDVDEYLKKNEFKIKNEVAVSADYYKTNLGEYEAKLSVKERDINLIEVKLSVPTPDLAENICENWEKNNREIYKYLIQQLF